MAKLKSGTELAVANQLSGDASTLVDKIVVAGSKRVVFYRTTCTQSEYEQGIEFEAGDAMSYIEDAGDVTISKDVTEKDMYMLTTKAKIPGSSTIGDVTYKEAITTDGIKHYLEVAKNDTGMAVACFDVGSKSMIYSLWGTISEITRSTPLGDDCTISYTLANSAIDVECTCPETKTP